MSHTEETAFSKARALGNPAFIQVFEEAESARSNNSATSALHGIPFAVKDNIDVAGARTTAAYPRDLAVIEEDAEVVARLRKAGAIPVGKTNMDQFATGLVGTRTPYGACHCIDSPYHISGGSSTGSAFAVAAGVVPLALGTDTAGSGRVPAAFNGLVGMKPTRGLVSTRGVFPAAPSLNCVSLFTKTVDLARRSLSVIAGFDPQDPWSRRWPTSTPSIARTMTMVGVPNNYLDLDAPHRVSWETELRRLEDVVTLVPVDVTPLLEAAQLLYGSPLVAERTASFGHLLESDDPNLDPVVKSIVLSGDQHSAPHVYEALGQLQRLKRGSELLFAGLDAILLPTTPGHPTFEDVEKDPIGVNARLGTYTNMVNLLDLCAIAIPAGRREDGLPFGVQLLAPAFADEPLLDLAEALMKKESPKTSSPAAEERDMVAVCGAHLSGEPLNSQLLNLGGVLERRDRTDANYRMFLIEGDLPRPALLRGVAPTTTSIDVEIWSLPGGNLSKLHALPPLTISDLTLEDGTIVQGFVAANDSVNKEREISQFGSWRNYLRHG